jgi:hypothetical protein
MLAAVNPPLGDDLDPPKADPVMSPRPGGGIDEEVRCEHRLATISRRSSSDHDDRIRPRTSSSAEIGQGSPHVEWEVALQRIARDRDDATVGGRIRDDEDHMLHRRIGTELAEDTSLDRLKVGQAGFGLERVDTAVSVAHRIPGAGVSDADQRHLRPPPDRCRQAIVHPPEQSDLRDVSNRVCIWVEANGRNEPDSETEPAELVDPDVLELATLEAVDLACRDAHGSPSIRAA